MPSDSRKKSKTPAPPSAAQARGKPSFAEAPAWRSIGNGWRPLFGNYHELGFSLEWHEFTVVKEFDWAPTFHPGSLELCLNIDGLATLGDGSIKADLPPLHYAFYYQGSPALSAVRAVGGQHRFITIEYSPEFLREHFSGHVENLHPLVAGAVKGEMSGSAVAPPDRLLATMQQLVESLKHCPVFTPAREMWFRCKALEVAAHLFFRPPGGEMLCTRAQRLARERVERARILLQSRLQNPPSLEELSKLVHCSPFYLSRLFTQEAGMTMQQYLRRIRMERAAELLRSGRCNVTEAAMEVGYSSLSHFSTTFHEIFGCCPGLYPFKTPSQRTGDEENG